MSLVAETTTGTFLSAELASNPQGQGAAVLPEDLGRNCAKLLLEEIYRVRPQPLQGGGGAGRKRFAVSPSCSLATFFSNGWSQGVTFFLPIQQFSIN